MHKYVNRKCSVVLLYIYKYKFIKFLHIFIVTCTCENLSRIWSILMRGLYFFIFAYIQIYFFPRINKAVIQSFIHWSRYKINVFLTQLMFSDNQAFHFAYDKVFYNHFFTNEILCRLFTSDKVIQCTLTDIWQNVLHINQLMVVKLNFYEHDCGFH